MKKLLIVLVVVAIGVVALGFYQGWFTAKTKTDNKGTELTVKIDQEKFKKDKEEYQKKAEAQLKELDSQLDKLAAKSKEASGDTKAKLDKEVAVIQQRWAWFIPG